MKKRILFLLTVIMICAITIPTGIYGFMSSKDKANNTFVLGNIGLSLSESTKNFALYDSNGLKSEIQKDPQITVKANSVPCYVYVKLEENTTFHDNLSYTINDGWTKDAAHSTEKVKIYYRAVAKSSSSQIFSVLKNNKVYVNNELTFEQACDLSSNPYLKITGYAIQQSGFDEAELAWATLNAIESSK